MIITKHSVEDHFKEKCQEIAGKDLPEVIFEGLDDITQLPDRNKHTEFVVFEDTDNGWVCIINGKYRLSNGVETAAVAIGLWNKERNCFSVFTKMKSGARLPAPLLMKGNAEEASLWAQKILLKLVQSFARSEVLSRVLDGYNMIAQKFQEKLL